MFSSRLFSCRSVGFFVFLVVGLATGQDSVPAARPTDSARRATVASSGRRIAFEDLVDSIVRQEHRLTDHARGFKPIVETYIQEPGAQYRFQRGVIPNGDDYFLSRLNLTGNSPSIVPFADEETWYQGGEKFFVQDPRPFSQVAFVQALFPDFGHFDRQNYTFEFIRWEDLGEVHCAVVDVRPHGNSKKRGFVGRIWVEDQDYNIVRFNGTFTSGDLAKRAFHFDSWRLNTLGNWWMPAYVYTEESKPDDLSSHTPWFKAQTRLWGYDLGNAGDRREDVSPRENAGQNENASQNENVSQQENASLQVNASQRQSPGQTDTPEDFPEPSTAVATHQLEDRVVDRSQFAGLMAPDGEVNQILETVVNNILITNDLDIPGVRCRVLLTTPLESFVMGRTIVLSRGLLDVLPDEATLAALLAHEIAHVVLGHDVSSGDSTAFGSALPDSEIFASLDFHFNRMQEADANKKGMELFSKSPYKGQIASAGLFLKALEASSGRFPILIHGRFSNDFASSHLVGVQAWADSHRLPTTNRLDQVSALPIGSRVVIDPWSDRIQMSKSKPVPLLSKAEKIPFQVTPFYPYLRRLDSQEKLQSGGQE